MRLDDPPLQSEECNVEPASLPGADQAVLVMTFLQTLESCGLPHEEALWLTAQFWRAS
jgi:hypothetical protein